MGISEKIKIKLFNRWAYKQYKKFIKKDNYDFDFSSILTFLELKFTIMGLYFAKYGISTENKKQARELWSARKDIKLYYNSFNEAYKHCQDTFFDKYKCKFETKMRWTPDNNRNLLKLDIDVISPVENKEEAEQFWNSLKIFNLEVGLENKYLNSLFTKIKDNIRGWWD